jgi:hypothetical protein
MMRGAHFQIFGLFAETHPISRKPERRPWPVFGQFNFGALSRARPAATAFC